MECFEKVCRNSDRYSLKPITYIAALLKNEDEVFYYCKTFIISELSADIYKVNDFLGEKI